MHYKENAEVDFDYYYSCKYCCGIVTRFRRNKVKFAIMSMQLQHALKNYMNLNNRKNLITYVLQLNESVSVKNIFINE